MSDTHLVVDGVDFAITANDLRGGRATARKSGALVALKTPWMIERYVAIRDELEPANVFELGIHDGGSTALFALMFRPKRFVAVDLTPERVTALDAFVRRHELGERVRPYYGVDQADRTRLEAILTDEFGTEPLDLVVDDASHLLGETTSSFNVLFPRLRPGGLFVIEDWSWQHFPDEIIERALVADERAAEEMMRRLTSGEVSPARDRPLSRLVLELVLTAAYADGVVAEVTSIRKGWVAVRRGDADLDPKTFDIRQCYGSLGRTLLT